MMIHSAMSVYKKQLVLFILLVSPIILFGQQMPFNPVSYRIFSPFILNPAAAGSKDYLSIDAIAGFTGKSYSQAISGNTRIVRKILGYRALGGDSYEFSNIGVGGMAFNDYTTTDSTHNTGLGASVSYHIPLDKRALSYLSVGATIKGLYHFHDGNPDLDIPSKEFYSPNIDFGVYFYNPWSYAGLSVNNLLNQPEDPDTLKHYNIPASRQYNFIAGYKFVINSDLNLVLEPSVIIHTGDSFSFNIKENIEPAVKLYAGSFCLGTYFNDYSKVSFFFQYRFPRFYIGTFFAMKKDSPYFKNPLTTEIAFGINFSHNKSGYTKYGHW